MDKKTYFLLENFMLSCMEDSAHDKEHVYRVLYNALDIAKTESNVDYNVLITSCLLGHGFEISFAEKVKQCIQTHRYRKNNIPQSLEAKILFDADKLDVAGAMGIARSLVYKGIVSEPLYSLLPDGTVSDGGSDSVPSFFQEYKYKLENLYSKFYTARASQLAKERQRIAEDFYNSLYQEASLPYQNGKSELDKLLQ